MNKISITKTESRFLLTVAFLSGMAIMAMEITASRLLAPYFGTSLFVWTNIIGIVLIALSAGYYVGGKLADRHPEINFLLKLIMIAGLSFAVIPWMIRPVVSFADINLLSRGASAVIFVSSLVTTAILFSLPFFILGMVSPFIIKIFSLTENERMGELSGKVFAVSTIGSILGTFLPTLYFIPFLGSRVTLSVFAFILILLGSFGFRRNKAKFASVIILPLVVAVYSQTPIKNVSGMIYESESAYQYISVINDKNDTRYLVYNEGGGIQSVYNQENILTGFYYDCYNILPHLLERDRQNKVLIVGLAGGTIARQLDYFFKNQINIEGVEIDKKVIEASKKYFGVDESFVKIHNQDGRMFLENSHDKYDLIIVDAYQNELHIPWTLTTSEFWKITKARMNDGGMVSINVNAISDSSALLNFIANTMASVFSDVYLFKVGENSSNYIIIATDHDLDLSSAVNMIENKELKEAVSSCVDNLNKVDYNSDKMVLTDDRAPVEFMTEVMFIDYLKGL